MSAVFDEKIQTTLADGKLQLAIYTATGRLIEKRRKAITPEGCPDYQELRTHANAVKRHTIDHLDYYLEQLAEKVATLGGQVYWAHTGDDVNRYIIELARARGVKLVARSSPHRHQTPISRRPAAPAFQAPAARSPHPASGRT